jgi:hypothetical protein
MQLWLASQTSQNGNSLSPWKCNSFGLVTSVRNRCMHFTGTLAGQENLADYQSKHHTGGHHTNVRPWYLDQPDSPRSLPWALKPSALKGCVGTLDNGYLCKEPLPRAPQIQSAALATCASPHDMRNTNTCYLRVPWIPTWSDLLRSQFGMARSTMLPPAPHWLMYTLIIRTTFV